MAENSSQIDKQGSCIGPLGPLVQVNYPWSLQMERDGGRERILPRGRLSCPSVPGFPGGSQTVKFASQIV